MKWILLVCIWAAAVSDSLAEYNPDSTVHRFLETLPYRAYYVVQHDQKQGWVRGWSFETLRWEACSAEHSDDSCFLFLQSPIAFPEKKFLIYFPLESDSLLYGNLVDPSGVNYQLVGTDKPPAPTLADIRLLNGVLDKYSATVDDYREAEEHIRWVNLEAKINGVLYLGCGAVAGMLIGAENADTRGVGYGLAGALIIGFVFDAHKYITGGGWRRVSRNARKEIESWNESSTREMLNSLQSPPSSDSLGVQRK